jgi:hypothetical protein
MIVMVMLNAEPSCIFFHQMLIPQLDPLTEQQLVGMCNLQQSSEQAEEALTQGLQQLHQSLADAVGAGPLNDVADVANYTSLMALALDRLDNLESFYRQVSKFSLCYSSCIVLSIFHCSDMLNHF